MFLVKVPTSYEAEHNYIVTLIFSEFLGFDVEVQLSNRQNIKIYSTNSPDRVLIIADKLFAIPSLQWLQPDSLPKQPLPIWDISHTRLAALTVTPEIPTIYGDDPNSPDFFQCSENKIYLGLDIFGSAFFMLTRYEEMVKPDRDQYDRFPGSASLAYQENFLDRPIVNEYVEILWACLKKLWPQLERKEQHFQTIVTHDVDIPYKYAFTDFSTLVRTNVVKHFSLKQAILNGKTWNRVKRGNLSADPFNTFDWLMNLSENHNLTSAFYFITDRTDSKMDGNYTIQHHLIRQLLKQIHKRNHEIGLHPSFNSYLKRLQIQKEYRILRNVCSDENIQQEKWGGRHHFLRWNNPYTWQYWEDAGLNYDSTLAFADLPGFRCGTCYEFPVFNLATRQALNLIERPLIVMECTVLDQRYMGLAKNLDSAFNLIKGFKDSCRHFNGNFTLLWHNSRFETLDNRDLYQQLLGA